MPCQDDKAYMNRGDRARLQCLEQQRQKAMLRFQENFDAEVTQQVAPRDAPFYPTSPSREPLDVPLPSAVLSKMSLEEAAMEASPGSRWSRFQSSAKFHGSAIPGYKA